MTAVMFRADASRTIGTGHVMRCLTLAAALRAQGAAPWFICREHDGNLCDLIERNGFQVSRLPLRRAATDRGMFSGEAWLGATVEEDAMETLAVVYSTGVRAAWLVADHYAIGKEWERLVRPSVSRMMVIDDLADRPHDCDVLLDQNFRLDRDSRYDALVPPPCTRLIGPRYALLRSEFAEVRRRMKRRAGPVRHVLVFLGGSDPANVTGRALEALTAPELADLEVDVVIGAGSPHAADIGRRVAERPKTTLHVQVRNMAELMARADLALGAVHPPRTPGAVSAELNGRRGR